MSNRCKAEPAEQELSADEAAYLEQMLRVLLAHDRPDYQLIEKYRHWRDKVTQTKDQGEK